MATAALTGRRETTNVTSRVTAEGRKITYQLTVIQQPERARACGSGAKSSADRRPVDPPPIVGLRVFAGEDALEDITFSYKANFFLFATLEPARPIAQGRVPQTTAAFPVLTGMFVSGMAYLDRPMPAGYFLFPDLSVRHEGKYLLSFNLYEETKEPNDFDVEPSTEAARLARARVRAHLPGLHAPRGFVDWRLEVKSTPFTVYSAKKFPGLAESTSLSRIVADQGCRVRIRRDVRMRRREPKAGGGSSSGAGGRTNHDHDEDLHDRPADDDGADDDEDDVDDLEPDPGDVVTEEVPSPAAMTGPPHPPPSTDRMAHPSDGHHRYPPLLVTERDPQSVGSTSASQPPPPPHHHHHRHDRYPHHHLEPVSDQTPYPLDLSRRPSIHDPSTNGHVSSASSYGMSATVMPPHPLDPSVSRSDGHPPPLSASSGHFHPPHHHVYGPGIAPPPPSSSSLAWTYPAVMSAGRAAVPSPALPSPYPRPDRVERAPSRRPAMSSQPPTTMMSTHSSHPDYLYADTPYARPPPSVSSRRHGGHGDDGASITAPSALHQMSTSSTSGRPLPPLNVAVPVENGYGSSSTMSSAGLISSVSDAGRSTKRPYGAVFDASAHDASLRHGMRPCEDAYGAEPLLAADEDDDDSSLTESTDLARIRMQYKRADGTEIRRRPPPMV